MDSSGIRLTLAFPLSSSQGSVGNATKGVEKFAAAESVYAASLGKYDDKDQLDLSSNSPLELLDKIDLYGAKPRAD